MYDMISFLASGSAVNVYGEKWILIAYMGRDNLFLAIKANDPFPCQTYLIEVKKKNLSEID